MKILFAVVYVLTIPLLLWSRWHGEPFIFNFLLAVFLCSGIGYLVLNERD